jgi:hypothetical protein
MEQRYVLRLRERRIQGTRYAVTEVRRLADDALLYQEWRDSRGHGLPSVAGRVLRKLQAAPDDQAEAIIVAIINDQMRAAVDRLSTDDLGLTQEERTLLGLDEVRAPPPPASGTES